MFKKIVIQFAAYIIAFVFITVGMSKILGHQDFVRVLHQSPIVEGFVHLVAYPVPVVEIIVGIALLVPAFRKYGFIASIILMIVFTVYNIYLLTFAPHVPCGCGGIFKGMSWTRHLYVNFGLLTLALLGRILTSSQPSDHHSVPLWSGLLFTLKKRRSVGNQ